MGPLDSLAVFSESGACSVRWRTYALHSFLSLARGFYEWHLNADGRKLPYYIHFNDQDVFRIRGAMGSLVQGGWHRDRELRAYHMPGNSLLRDIHTTGSNPHRKPVILRKEDREAWLHGTTEQAEAALSQYSADLMVAYSVSTQVNTPKNEQRRWISLSGEPLLDSPTAHYECE